jgi:hypothetical protein
VNEFLRILRDLDVPAARAAWAVIGSAPAGNDAALLATLHLARTQTEALPAKLRIFSHGWLVDRGYPSRLPDDLRPKPEQVDQRVATGVGIAVHSELPGVADAVRGAMERAVSDAYAEGREDPEFVRARMDEARAKELGALGLGAQNIG